MEYNKLKFIKIVCDYLKKSDDPSLKIWIAVGLGFVGAFAGIRENTVFTSCLGVTIAAFSFDISLLAESIAIRGFPIHIDKGLNHNRTDIQTKLGTFLNDPAENIETVSALIRVHVTDVVHQIEPFKYIEIIQRKALKYLLYHFVLLFGFSKFMPVKDINKFAMISIVFIVFIIIYFPIFNYRGAVSSNE